MASLTKKMAASIILRYLKPNDILTSTIFEKMLRKQNTNKAVKPCFLGKTKIFQNVVLLQLLPGMLSFNADCGGNHSYMCVINSISIIVIKLHVNLPLFSFFRTWKTGL